jgi:hypothetical protein
MRLVPWCADQLRSTEAVAPRPHAIRQRLPVWPDTARPLRSPTIVISR